MSENPVFDSTNETTPTAKKPYVPPDMTKLTEKPKKKSVKFKSSFSIASIRNISIASAFRRSFDSRSSKDSSDQLDGIDEMTANGIAAILEDEISGVSSEIKSAADLHKKSQIKSKSKTKAKTSKSKKILNRNSSIEERIKSNKTKEQLMEEKRIAHEKKRTDKKLKCGCCLTIVLAILAVIILVIALVLHPFKNGGESEVTTKSPRLTWRPEV